MNATASQCLGKQLDLYACIRRHRNSLACNSTKLGEAVLATDDNSTTGVTNSCDRSYRWACNFSRKCPHCPSLAELYTGCLLNKGEDFVFPSGWCTTELCSAMDGRSPHNETGENTADAPSTAPVLFPTASPMRETMNPSADRPQASDTSANKSTNHRWLYALSALIYIPVLMACYVFIRRLCRKRRQRRKQELDHARFVASQGQTNTPLDTMVLNHHEEPHSVVSALTTGSPL